MARYNKLDSSLFMFLGFKKYLETLEQRLFVGKLFIAGTVPVIVTCFAQYWFGWYGPLETLNGLIVWYQRPIGFPHVGVTGLFSNQIILVLGYAPFCQYH